MQKAVQHLKENLKPTFSTKYRNVFLVLGLSFFILFGLITLLVQADLLRSFDFNTTVRLQDDVPIKFDGFFSFLSVVGRFEFSITILLVILFFRKKILGIIAFGLFGFSHVIEIIGKTILSQPGPPHMFLRTTDLSMSFPGLYIHTDASFPSGHAMRALFLCTMIVFILWKSKKMPANLRYLIIGIVILYAILMIAHSQDQPPVPGDYV